MANRRSNKTAWGITIILHQSVIHIQSGILSTAHEGLRMRAGAREYVTIVGGVERDMRLPAYSLWRGPETGM